ncbi:MAG: hypothetical protein JRH12_22330 [Deltaproteobacteria bacterium]|jgi:hypothetical protein|nr:hypothetical protein [Deltaproteobacteria bacterium]
MLFLKHKNMIANTRGVTSASSRSGPKFNHLKILAVLLLMGIAGGFISNPGFCGATVAEEIISLEFVDQPLGKVLDDIAATTGYRFIFDESWENFLISASINDEPLHKGLKRILRKLNNAIIYSSDRTIKIIIFDEVVASEDRSNTFDGRRSDDGSVQRSYAFPARAVPPSALPNEELSDLEEDNRQLEQGDATAAEPDEVAETNEEPAENETGDSDAETGTDGSEQKEDTAGTDEESSDQPATDNQ